MIDLFSTGCHDCLLEFDNEGTGWECIHPETDVDEDTVKKAWWADARPTNCPLVDYPVVMRSVGDKTIAPYMEDEEL